MSLDDAVNVFADDGVVLMSGILNGLSVASGVLSLDDEVNVFVDDSVVLMTGM